MTQNQLDEWNDTFPIGSPCWVRHDDGSEHTHHTRSKAYECPCANKGHVVVKVDGLSHSVDLDRVFMAETHELKPHNDPSSATRRTGRNDCNRDVPAGFAAAHG